MNASRLSIDESAADTLVATGVVDSHTADGLGTALEARGTEASLRLDLSAVDFIDSSGLRVIIAAHTSLADAGRRLTLVGISESVERLFKITGLLEHLHID